MKNFLFLLLVLFFVSPAVSFAGSATSRWDLTIGGYVKVDAGYATQAASGTPQGLEAFGIGRNDGYGNQAPDSRSGSFAMAAGATTLNFLIRGPDTWGAKTSAFIQGMFNGQVGNGGFTGTRYGTFTLTHAYMDFTWASTKLTVGQAWQSWGFQPSYNFMGSVDLAGAGRGSTVPQVTLTQNFTKSFYGSFGIQNPYNMKDQLGGAANLTQAQNPTGQLPSGTSGSTSPTGTRATTQIPDFVGEVGFKSDACGRIGPNVLQFALGGFWGQDNVIFVNPAQPNTYSTQHVVRWAAAFKAFIPIIPCLSGKPA